MNITVVGAGYVGLVSAACLADVGHVVVCIDVDVDRVASLTAGVVPIFEPGLDEIIERTAATSNLSFTTDYRVGLADAETILVAVGTPSDEEGNADLSAVMAVVDTLGSQANSDAVVVLKSTVPVGTADAVTARLIDDHGRSDLSVVSNPEFLREGSAISDFVKPDRIVIGSSNDRGRTTVKAIYRPFIERGVPLLTTSLPTAEMIKYASNAFLAVKVGFINEIADLTERVGADITDVTTAMGLDARISPAFLRPGPGYGGSCFPKDTRALVRTASDAGTEMRIVEASIRSNRRRASLLAERIVDEVGVDARVAALGLTFKAETDDIRESPAIAIISHLLERGIEVRAYDPQGIEAAKQVLDGAEFVGDPYEAAAGVDALVMLTEWPEFADLDLGRLKQVMTGSTLFDFRNSISPAAATTVGFDYHSIGRPPVLPSH